jgi:hypothetical protein
VPAGATYDLGGSYAAPVFRFDAELWLHEGEAAWHFVTVPGGVSDAIEAETAGRRRGFGSVRVRATVGKTTWTTSVFPDRGRRAFLLPVKKDVRAREGIRVGDVVPVSLELVDG